MDEAKRADTEQAADRAAGPASDALELNRETLGDLTDADAAKGDALGGFWPQSVLCPTKHVLTCVTCQSIVRK